MGTVLGILALILLVWGVWVLIKGAILFGIILIVVGLVLAGSYGFRDRRGPYV